MKKLITICAVTALLALLGPLAQAALIDRGADTLGNHLIYDTDLNITWYDAPAVLRNWSNSMNWAASLTVGNTTAGTWRLPTMLNADGTLPPVDPIIFYNFTSSEMGHLYYVELQNVAGGPLANTGPFANLLPNIYYSSTRLIGAVDYGPLYCNFSNGWQANAYDFTPYYALAVHPGDVAVPEPATMALLGLGGFGLLRRKK